MNIRAEILKAKNTSAIWLTFFASIFIPFISFIAALNRPLALAKYYGTDPWFVYLSKSWQNVSSFLLPMYIILLCGLIAQIEYRNGTWKQVFASPRSYFDIYVSKFIVVLLLILLSLLIFDLSLIVSAYATSLISSKFIFERSPLHMMEIIKMTLKMFISILGLSAIQYWLAVRFKNFIISFGIGLGMLLACVIVGNNWEKTQYIPYTYPWQIFMNQANGLSGKVHDTLLYSVVVFGLVMLFGLIDLVYRKEKA